MNGLLANCPSWPIWLTDAMGTNPHESFWDLLVDVDEDPWDSSTAGEASKEISEGDVTATARHPLREN